MNMIHDAVCVILVICMVVLVMGASYAQMQRDE